MAKGRNNSRNTKGGQSSSPRNNGKSGSRSNQRRSSSKRGTSYDDNYENTERNYPSKEQPRSSSTNRSSYPSKDRAHTDTTYSGTNRPSKVTANDTSSNSDSYHTSKPRPSYDDNNNSDNYQDRNNSKPINDPPPYEDADMNFTEEEVYGNTYSKNPENEADMTFTEDEVYGNETNDNDADMTFTEEEVYGNTTNQENNNNEQRRGASNNIRSSFEICTPFAEYYLEFRETLVRNAPDLRRQMISRSNASHIGNVIDNTPDLRNIHTEYRNAGARPGQIICLHTRVVRDERRYVSQIRFTAPDMHTFEDEPIVSDIQQRTQRELETLRRRFTRFTNRIIGTVPTYFGRPDSHDITLASAISMYCNNMIRLSRGSRTMIPYTASRDVNRPIVRTAQSDWNALSNGNERPALYRQDDLVIDSYRNWARQVLRRHGNTTDEATIENFLRGFNGYRNY